MLACRSLTPGLTLMALMLGADSRRRIHLLPPPRTRSDQHYIVRGLVTRDFITATTWAATIIRYSPTLAFLLPAFLGGAGRIILPSLPQSVLPSPIGRGRGAGCRHTLQRQMSLKRKEVDRRAFGTPCAWWPAGEGISKRVNPSGSMPI
ncbi:hypothetical protein FB451DRAFT_49652 [Mycena latifolia]|nr:hypothetical protein FB451DRAFT_49652 [Mycena latifolia]